MIAQNVPGHLIAGARTGFLKAVRDQPATWKSVAMQHNLSGSSTDLVDLGAAPMPTSGKNGPNLQDFAERLQNVTVVPWELTVWISSDAIDDDRTNTLRTKVASAGSNFNRHINQQVFSALNLGDTTTYGTCYNGKTLFNNAHVDKGAAYQTGQDNLYALALDNTNFNTVYVAHSMLRDDQGEIAGMSPDLLVVSPANMVAAAQITNNANAADTANREINPYQGSIRFISVPWLDSSAWYLVDSSLPVKPIILAMRKAPALQSAWFDPEATDGGRFYFKFYARYHVTYGDWRLAIQGNT